MSNFEAGRVKILDENTRQVIKEIDALTSDEAVLCDNGSITLKDKLADLSNSINQSSQSVTTIVKNYDQNFEQTNQTISNQETEIQNILKKNNQYDSNFTSINQQFTDISKQFDSVNTKFSNMNNSIVSNADEITDLNKAVNKHQEYIDAIKQANLTQSNQIDELTLKVENLINLRKSDIVVFSQPADPGNSAKPNDIWYNTTTNVFEVKQSNNTWKIIGAAYN